MATYNLGKRVDVVTWPGKTILAPGQTTTMGFSWDFTVYDYVHLDASPISDKSSVQVLTQWAYRENPTSAEPIEGRGIWRYATFKNNGDTPVSFVVHCIRSPSKY